MCTFQCCNISHSTNLLPKVKPTRQRSKVGEKNLLKFKNLLKNILSTYLPINLFVQWDTHAMAQGQRQLVGVTWFSTSTMCTSETELRLLGLAASSFTC